MKSILLLLLFIPMLTWAQRDTNREEVFLVVQQMPKFIGGDEALMEYIKEGTIYPQVCRDSNITGTVYVQCVINIAGRIEQVKITRSVHPLLDEEAMRVVSHMPRWEPGKQNGKLVNVQYTLPIRFGD